MNSFFYNKKMHTQSDQFSDFHSALSVRLCGLPHKTTASDRTSEGEIDA